ncbi:hypothetical protein C0989_002869 [Termitomyces sp. Mn162]|nr:hypothetical protein C0989_002869 [Termitomyces sp. Mn162]
MGPKNRKWEKEIKTGDYFIEDGREGDFINTLLGGNCARVGNDLQSETQHIHHYQLTPNRRIFVVDTPGFDDTSTKDREILRRIAVWMAKSCATSVLPARSRLTLNRYSDKAKVGGIIYLQEITQARVTGTVRRNFDMFEKLCGPNAATHIILTTTKWSDVKPDVGAQREIQLRDHFWNDMLRDGSKMRQFRGTQNSAKEIVQEILVRRALDAAQIQDELVEVDKLLSETEAGRTLRYTLKEALEEQKKMAARLRTEGGDDFRDQVIENDSKIRALLGQISALDIPLGRRVLRALGLLKG